MVGDLVGDLDCDLYVTHNYLTTKQNMKQTIPFISPEKILKLNHKYSVPFTVMERTVKYTKNLSEDNRDFYSLVKTPLKAYSSLKRGGDIREVLYRIFTRIAQ